MRKMGAGIAKYSQPSMDPRVLFIAEPTRGIDISAKEIILEKLLDINREIGTSMVLLYVFYKTKIGIASTAVGENERFARLSGMPCFLKEGGSKLEAIPVGSANFPAALFFRTGFFRNESQLRY